MAKRNHKYRRIVAQVFNHPWAILPSKLEQITELLTLRSAGYRLSRSEIAARIGDNDQPPLKQMVAMGRTVSGERPSQIAVLNLFGTIFPRADMFTEISGGVSVEVFGRAFDAAVADDSVSAVVINADSPGGQYPGIPEVGDRIYEARGTKPIIAVANHVMCSGALWLAAQADEIVSVPSATDIGSIGVLNVHRDESVADEKAGVKYTFVRSAEFKAVYNSHEPLTEENRQRLQERVNTLDAMFIDVMARGRGVSVETARANFGQGRTFLAADALKAGLIDRIATFDEVLAGLGATGSPSSGFSARHQPAFAAATNTQDTARFQTVRELMER